MPAPSLSLKGRALRFLSLREHSRSELARKLAPHAESAEQVDALLDELTALGFLSEQRFVESLLHRRAARHGSGRIRQELNASGVDPADHQEALDALKDSELSRARAVWSRRYASAPSDLNERARQTRFLLARGFSSAIVRQVRQAAAHAEIDDTEAQDRPD